MSESKESRKVLIRQYKEREKQIGIFTIRNTVTGRLFLDKSVNLDVAFNKHRFQLNNGSHPNKHMQADWAQHGEQAFVYEIIETLKPKTDDAAAIGKDLDVLKDLCRQQIAETSGNNIFY